MRHKLAHAGTLAFDYLVLWLALNAALILVLPFLMVVSGVHRYATTPADARSLANLFQPVRETPRHHVWLTLFFLVVLLAAYGNLMVLPASGLIATIVQILTYVLLGIAALIFLHAPAILNAMHVTVPELFHNAVMLSFASPLDTLTRLGLLALLVYAAVNALPLFLFGLPIAIVLIARSSNHTLTQLKEKMK